MLGFSCFLLLSKIRRLEMESISFFSTPKAHYIWRAILGEIRQLWHFMHLSFEVVPAVRVLRKMLCRLNTDGWWVDGSFLYFLAMFQ